jgi:hypothetical protein
MAAHTPANAGLLLDDDDDTLVPIAARIAAATAQPPEPAHVLASAFVHPAEAQPELVRRAIEWVTCPTPTLGWRAAVFYVTGLNLGPSRRERDLRLQFCALYRAAHSPQPDPER